MVRSTRGRQLIAMIPRSGSCAKRTAVTALNPAEPTDVLVVTDALAVPWHASPDVPAGRRAGMKIPVGFRCLLARAGCGAVAGAVAACPVVFRRCRVHGGKDSGWLPADAGISLGREPVCKSGAGALTCGSRIVALSTPVRILGSRPRPPGIRGCALLAA